VSVIVPVVQRIACLPNSSPADYYPATAYLATFFIKSKFSFGRRHQLFYFLESFLKRG
jgi:hypothetical protein